MDTVLLEQDVSKQWLIYNYVHTSLSHMRSGRHFQGKVDEKGAYLRVSG